MRRPTALRAVVTLVATMTTSSGCGGEIRTPSEPSAQRSSTPNTLSISAFSVAGWFDGQFHYFPRLSVATGGSGAAIDVLEISFEGSTAGVPGPVQRVRYPTPRRVLAGSTLELTDGSSLFEIRTSRGLDQLTVSVSFVDETERFGTVVGGTVVPAVSDNTADATLTIRSFSVAGRFSNGRFYYLPKLTLAETAGRSPAMIVKITFELLDVGSSGRVPPSREQIVVPAGGTVVLDEDPYGYGPWLEIDSVADASRVSVVISYIDLQGRGGAASALATVSR
jgi:hypothetical protein